MVAGQSWVCCRKIGSNAVCALWHCQWLTYTVRTTHSVWSDDSAKPCDRRGYPVRARMGSVIGSEEWVSAGDEDGVPTVNFY